MAWQPRSSRQTSEELHRLLKSVINALEIDGHPREQIASAMAAHGIQILFGLAPTDALQVLDMARRAVPDDGEMLGALADSGEVLTDGRMAFAATSEPPMADIETVRQELGKALDAAGRMGARTAHEHISRAIDALARRDAALKEQQADELDRQAVAIAFPMPDAAATE